MKKTFILLGALLTAVCGYGENKIQMVTYFPVPYVAYSKVNVNKQMDVGLTNTCAMNLGCNESGSAGLKPLQATTVNLNQGKLDLNTGAAAVSNSVTIGSGAGIAEMNFGKDVRIGTLNNGYTVETNQMTVDVLKLFPSRIKNDFPSCASTGASGAPQVSWQQLQLKGKNETYLVCGTPKESTCYPPANESALGACPLGYSGVRTRTWNYTTCQWGPWVDNCKKNEPETYKYVKVEDVSIKMAFPDSNTCPDKTQLNCSGNGGGDGSYYCSVDKMGMYAQSGAFRLIDEYMRSRPGNYEIVTESISAGGRCYSKGYSYVSRSGLYATCTASGSLTITGPLYLCQ